MTEAQPNRRTQRQRERRARKQQDKILTSAVSVSGGGAAEDWHEDEAESFARPRHEVLSKYQQHRNNI